MKKKNILLALVLISIFLSMVLIKSPKYVEIEEIKVGGKVGNIAPEISSGGEWINSDPLKIKDLKGKVVMIDFWTYSCINCLNTIPYMVSWDEKYSDQGLIIIGVHSPEFKFERDLGNVIRSVDELGIEYAVVQDNNFETWNAYYNRWWPSKYLIDKNGIIRYNVIGEGGYEETEDWIIRLLRES